MYINDTTMITVHKFKLALLCRNYIFEFFLSPYCRSFILLTFVALISWLLLSDVTSFAVIWAFIFCLFFWYVFSILFSFFLFFLCWQIDCHVQKSIRYHQKVALNNCMYIKTVNAWKETQIHT